MFEFIGKSLFSKTRPLFFFILLLIPCIAAVFFSFMQIHHFQDLQSRFIRAARKEKTSSERKRRKEQFLAFHRNANPYFLDQEIESITFLQEEKKMLQNLLFHPAFSQNKTIYQYLTFLEKNTLQFMEENAKSSASIKEVHEKQKTPVQMNESDLQKLLTLIEHTSIGPYLPPENAPQLIVKELKLKKCQTPFQTDVFEMEIDLLKREFLQ